ncbi:MAG: 6-pyruvoyl tetrahydropterin synthase family protein [Candidatus Hodarchaeaceae archaeon]|nr:6-pyruvoyl tetrahydropterin synthase family protein [Candidatus Hodarchaeaceae archaeon]
MRIELTEGLGFSAAHFIIGHKKCEHLHGHNWRLGVTVEGEPDERGLVVDLLELKRVLGKICEGYDHRLLLPAKNSALKRLSEGKVTRISVHGREFEFPSEDVIWVPAVNTTVEELSRVVADEVVKSLSTHQNVKKITVLVEESPGESATEERRVKA